MQKQRQENERKFSRKTIGGIGLRWSGAGTFRILAGAACVSLALAACGGHNGSDSTSSATPSPTAAPQSLEATAALAAKSTTVPLAMSLKMNASGIAPDTQTDRFIVKYKTGTPE
ncbi:hypothetical protein R69927_07384 [Paraburkholderia domus]|jgi:hypothetical protein|uniref:Uncharacterized protein n=1 Tax=Paraburkholderia domus TaxID=2793075 RepID=A0A9N8N1L2_9BURK|nr:hypothetical protein [Paraburkholderia domus]MBK5050848.1 hypothetical protein [Burkholderia sp. R-70006]MBK5060987.1 hypothetical protein [Burkholderia sp. R-70199]MBK5091398.1 hypothetical protein [Burkholderia sp. R-69927]MBK5121285.1 hypothetical protein [Burkholderia sp. R-69980]MBK5166182.1 hypothetical protein [Burkholderia sp. R-70211]